jgi:hypothetical protein
MPREQPRSFADSDLHGFGDDDHGFHSFQRHGRGTCDLRTSERETDKGTCIAEGSTHLSAGPQLQQRRDELVHDALYATADATSRAQ